MKNTITIIALFLVLALLASCDTKSTKNGNNTIVLIDISKSIGSEVLESYIEIAEKSICKKQSQFDKIIFLPIDGASQTASKALLEIDFFEYQKEWDVMGKNSNETEILKKEAFTKFLHSKMIELKNEIHEAQVHRENANSSTDILGALQTATSKFDVSYYNSIIIMSDMEQYADACKMTEAGRSAAWLTKTNTIKLDNIDQFTIAIITGEQLNMKKTYYNEISSFWHAFFTKRGVKNLIYEGGDASNLKNIFIANN